MHTTFFCEFLIVSLRPLFVELVENFLTLCAQLLSSSPVEFASRADHRDPERLSEQPQSAIRRTFPLLFANFLFTRCVQSATWIECGTWADSVDIVQSVAGLERQRNWKFQLKVSNLRSWYFESAALQRRASSDASESKRLDFSRLIWWTAMESHVDFYEILELSRTATQSEIKKA